MANLHIYSSQIYTTVRSPSKSAGMTTVLTDQPVTCDLRAIQRQFAIDYSFCWMNNTLHFLSVYSYTMIHWVNKTENKQRITVWAFLLFTLKICFCTWRPHTSKPDGVTRPRWILTCTNESADSLMIHSGISMEVNDAYMEMVRFILHSLLDELL